MNLEEVLVKEGSSFLQLMREMMTDEDEATEAKETRGPCYHTARISDEEDLDEKSTDDDYVPGVVKRTGTRTRIRVSGSDEPVLKPTKSKGFYVDGFKGVGRMLLDDALKS